MAVQKNQPFLMYKGKPLVRSGDQLYYGSMNDPYVVFMQVMSKRQISGQTAADKVNVQLVRTDPDAPVEEQMLQNAVRTGIYDSLELGRTWLEREQQ
ncbi:MAG: hypothetical protein LBQ80_00275 [Clostridium sp.]|jgi:hypothetical protein|nr:hypothetical protein [Clostridium sp.]